MRPGEIRRRAQRAQGEEAALGRDARGGEPLPRPHSPARPRARRPHVSSERGPQSPAGHPSRGAAGAHDVRPAPGDRGPRLRP